MPGQDEPPRRVAVVAADATRRASWARALGDVPHTDVVAWAEEAALLLVLGARVDVCVCDRPPDPRAASRLHERGIAVVVLPPDTDPVEALRPGVLGRAAPPPGRPNLAPRQREVLVAYVAGNDLLPTVARRLGMQRETFKTHLRRIRLKYQEAGRPAPTRRDLYVRAVEDGLIPPPQEDRRFPRESSGG